MNPRVSLRKVISADLQSLYEHQCDAEACRIADFQSRDRHSFLAHWSRILPDPSVIARAVIFNNELAGNVCSFDAHGRREIGYWIGRPFWGRGIASAAVRQFLAIEPFRPLFAHVAFGNIASVRVLEKCGFAITPKFETSGNLTRRWYESVLVTSESLNSDLSASSGDDP